MGVVHLFGSRKEPIEENSAAHLDAANSNETGQVIELVINRKIAHGVPPKTVYRQMEALLVTNGVDLGCEKARADYKIVTYLVQGMMDRAGGEVASDRCIMLDTIRHSFANEEALNFNDSQELFGDLLGRLD